MQHLSVVLISKNQAWSIARLIESVLHATEDLGGTEIVHVDSASTDTTAEVASAYPISVLRLRPDQRLTAAAGRYVGYTHTTGDLILFLDGDMELCADWLHQALEVMENNADIALLTGRVVDRPKAWAGVTQPSPQGEDATLTELEFCGGAALYRRAVLEQVGTFNPFLYSEEEPELCLRIRHAGYRIARIERTIAYHYSDPDGELATVIGRWRRNLYLGAGQNLRYMYGSELFWPYLSRRGYAIAPLVGVVAGLMSVLVGLARGRWRWLGAWSLALLAVIGGNAWRKRSLARSLTTVITRLCILDGAIRGALLTPLSPDQYPAKIDTVKLINTPAQHEKA